MSGDKVNPAHYISATGLECHQAQRAVLGQAGMMAYWHGCAIKYLWRCWHKNGVEDLRKAIRCLEFLIEELAHDIGPGPIPGNGEAPQPGRGAGGARRKAGGNKPAKNSKGVAEEK